MLLGVLGLTVVAVTFVVHAPALDARAISFDDDEYLLDNGLVQHPSWSSARQFLSEVLEPSTVRGHYQPLSMISLMLDYALGGRADNLRPFHRTSVLLHVMNTVLVMVLLYQLVGRPWAAAGAALVFGVHPLAIESVAWIAERKTLLAAFFALGSLILYVRYARTRGWPSYGLSLAALVLGLMSKPSCTPLPLLMLLLDFWPLCRFGTSVTPSHQAPHLAWGVLFGGSGRRSVLEKAPFFLVAGVAAVVTYLSQHKTYGTTLIYEHSPFGVLLLMGHNIVFYLSTLAWPGELSWFYPYPQPFSLSNPVVLRRVIGTGVLFVLLGMSLRWTRALATGFLFFLLAVLPTMSGVAFCGLIAADRFVYLPMVGVLLILAWLLAASKGLPNSASIGESRRLPSGTGILPVKSWAGSPCHIFCRGLLGFGLTVWATALAMSTHRHLAYWKDSEALSRRMTELVPNSSVPRVGLGNALLADGRAAEAIREYREAIRIEPNEAATHTGLGTALSQVGQMADAVVHYTEALRLDPENARTMNNLGTTLVKQKRFGEAAVQFRQALELRPRYTQAHLNLATSLDALGKSDEAVDHCLTAVRLTPGDPRAYQHLGGMLLRQGKPDEAVKAFRQAIDLKPDFAAALVSLANSLYLQGAELQQLNQLDKAIGCYTEAVRLRPGFSEARNNLGAALADQERLEEAVAQYQEGLRLDPKVAVLHANLGDALLRLGRIDEAAQHFRDAVRLEPESAELHFRLANLLTQIGDAAEADAQYREVLRIEPDHSQAREKLGVTHGEVP